MNKSSRAQDIVSVSLPLGLALFLWDVKPAIIAVLVSIVPFIISSI